MGANRIIARESDLASPRLAVAHINRLYDQAYALLGQVAALEVKMRGVGGGGGGGGSGTGLTLTADDRRLLDSLARGSTESSVPATKAIVPPVDALPPTATSTPGQLAQLRSTGVVYVFDGANWNSISAAASPHSILSATHSDSVAAAVVRGDVIVGNATPKWARLGIGAALRLLRVNAGGTDPEWGGVDDSMLSANVALIAAINAFTVEQQFRALTALTIGGGANVNGAMHQLVLQAEEVNLAGVATRDSAATLIAGDSLVLPVLAFITQTISGGGVTKFKSGDAATLDRFHSDDSNLTAGTAFWMFNHWRGGVASDAAGPTQTAAAKVRTTLDAAPVQGKIRYVTCALVGTPPTS